tara:strand:- start:119 stop:430 length:312 start_codon:yes stop_codon:yes gene_type:complete
MSTIGKFRITWIIIVIVATVLGSFLLFHGGVHGGYAQRNNQPTLVYQLEVFVGLILFWPVTIYGWLNGHLRRSNISGFEAWIFQICGYFALYKIHEKIKFKNI